MKAFLKNYHFGMLDTPAEAATMEHERDQIRVTGKV
jgi:hypothetical protein